MTPAAAPPPRFAELRVAAFFAALFGALGAHMPFWPLWLVDWGLSEGEAGAYLAAGLAARLVAGLLLPVLADRHGARRLTLGLVGAAGAALFLGHLFIGSKAVLLAATLLGAGVFSAMVPIGDALALAAARDGGFPYARTRAAGSAAFLGMTLGLGGAIAAFGADAALWAVVAGLLAAGIFGATHPGGGRVRAGKRAEWGEMRRLASRPVFLKFALAAGLAQAAHAPLYAYGSLHWRSLGIDEGTIGGLWAAGVAAEIVLMAAFGPAMLRLTGASGALALAGAASVIRFGAMAFDPSGPALWALQLMHAPTFAAAHLGAMAFLGAAAPERLSAAAQAALTVLGGGLAMAGGTALAAALYPALGGGTFALGAALGAGAVALAWAGRRDWDGGALRV